MAANLVFKNGYYQTKSRSFDVHLIQKGLLDFIEHDSAYKSQYLQKNYHYGFDGYSYMGQEDSTNQYATDLLHSFVISDFEKQENFPKEFNPFFKKDWMVLEAKIRELELEIIKELDYPGLLEFYQQHMGHMISCNYYPPTQPIDENLDVNTRLSEHTDVSLFTIFPFGFDSDFYFENEKGEWVNIAPTNDIIVFPGYLLECFTLGKWKALNHKVSLPKNRTKERFSFAYFSLPYPIRAFIMAQKEYTSERYFEQYLNLF